MDYPFTVAALDIGGTKIAGALLTFATPDRKPTVDCEHTQPTAADRGGDAVLASACELARTLVEEAHEQGFSVCGVGISTAGRVDAASESIAYANDIMPGWSGQPVAERLRDSLELPVAVLNDVQAHALGEARWGAARGIQTCLMVAVGTGMGGAVIAHGRVLRGKHGFAGEIGHVPCAQAAGIPCACGGNSHVESVASGSGIEARYAEASGTTVSGAQIAQRSCEGEPLARQTIMQAGLALGEVLAGLTNVLDPDMVVLGGSVTRAGSAWRAALQQGFERQIPPAQRDLPIVYAELGDHAPLVGAAENLLDSLKG